MKSSYFLIALVLCAWLLTACGVKETPVLAVPEGAQAGDFSGFGECENQPANTKTKYTAECGTLYVPENWDETGERLIALPVVRFPTKGPNPAAPVFYLHGGPGASNLSWEPPAWLLEKHAVVMVGYRGADGSMVLTCPEVGPLLKAHVGKDLYSHQARREYVAATQKCAESFQQAGVDLSGYTIPGVIQDMEAARTALGYDRINLFSESYGTRVAQIYAYLHPESLNRLVLVSVNTPGHFLYDPAVLDGMVEYLSELCTQDAACSSRTDDFAGAMYTVTHNMPKRWLFFNIDPDTVRMATHFMFFFNKNMPMIFDAYLAAAEGDPSGLAMANLIMSMTMPVDDFILGDLFNKAETVDLEKYGGIESISLGDSILGAPHSEMFWPMAAVWPIELIAQDLREFQESDVEMLLVNGTVDFSTPPNALDEARPYYHKAQMVLLPEFSHVSDVHTLQPQAFKQLITSYYETGVADTSLFVYQPLSFKPGLMNIVVLAKLLAAAMIVLPALIVLGVVLVVRRVRRRRNADQ